MENKLISIITVCYNSESHIEKCLKSVINQTYPCIEYIIVDGNSQDKTIEIVRKYEDKISRIISEDDNGIYDAMNKGITCASGEVIYFLNSDDYLIDNNVINDVMYEFNNHNVDVVYGDVRANGKVIKYRQKIKRFDLIKQTICHQVIFCKRNILLQQGGFDIRYKVCADYKFVIKTFINNSFEIKYINRTIVNYSTEGFSSKNNYEYIISLEKNNIITENIKNQSFKEKSFMLISSIIVKVREVIRKNFNLYDIKDRRN
ncbi:Glycosyl transferase family 2 [Clostridium acidisoli DSM 12555]|uniref:Glycosyl transferase family 2 n=1 Tax=Clostridium acidisoli DSM 12555 TaxID=1121291 RepID=A0A1W1XGW3_9CLOT|nr:glycosyltransferase family 2 protein [Clostridium acidisoli]SMC23235.1 Glycosyl transferase family 2 [Clostridium acidisoli DSM 12555]